jgi:hypothetical protein
MAMRSSSPAPWKHESKLWKNYGNIPFVLAADNAPGKKFAREISVQKGEVTVNDLKID